MMHDIVFLFDVDNTLLNNDRVQADLDVHIGIEHGAPARKRYWEIFEELRSELGYADYLGALERYRLEEMHDPRLLRMSNWLVDYPFADRLYPGALDAVKHAQAMGAGGHPVRRRRGVPAAQGRAFRPVAGVRRPRADLHPQGRGAGRRRAAISRQALRDDRRQAAHPGHDEEDLGRRASPRCFRGRATTRPIRRYWRSIRMATSSWNRIGDLVNHDLSDYRASNDGEMTR